MQEQEPHAFLPASCPCLGVGITPDGEVTPRPSSLGAYLPRLGGGVPDAVETILGHPPGARGLEEPMATQLRGGEPPAGSSRGPSRPTCLPHSDSTGGHSGRCTEPQEWGDRKAGRPEAGGPGREPQVCQNKAVEKRRLHTDLSTS